MDAPVVRGTGGSKSNVSSGQIHNNATHRTTVTTRAATSTATVIGNGKTNKTTANGIISRPAQPHGNATDQVTRAGPSKSVQSGTISSMNHQPVRTTTSVAPAKKSEKTEKLNGVADQKGIPTAQPRRITRTTTLAAAGDKAAGIPAKGTTGNTNGIARGGISKSLSQPVQLSDAHRATRVAAATLAASVKPNRADLKVPVKQPGQLHGSTATNGIARGAPVGVGVTVAGGSKSLPSASVNGPLPRTTRTTTSTSLAASKKPSSVDPTRLNRAGQANGTVKARVAAFGAVSKSSVQTGAVNGARRPAVSVPLVNIHTDGANLTAMNEPVQQPENTIPDLSSSAPVSEPVEAAIPADIQVSNEDSKTGFALRSDGSSVTNPDAVDGSCLSKSSERIFIPERSKEEHVKYFRDLIADERRYLSTMADKWDKILENSIGESDSSQCDISEEGIDLIRLAVGQSRLFMSKKLQQFVGLVDDCEFQRGERDTSPTDLAGFWEMINMQVINIHDKFDKVETLSANNWVAPEVHSINMVDGGKAAAAGPAKRALKPINGKSKPVIQGKSNIREMIERARREKAAQMGSLDVPEVQDIAPTLA